MREERKRIFCSSSSSRGNYWRASSNYRAAPSVPRDIRAAPAIQPCTCGWRARGSASRCLHACRSLHGRDALLLSFRSFFLSPRLTTRGCIIAPLRLVPTYPRPPTLGFQRDRCLFAGNANRGLRGVSFSGG